MEASAREAVRKRSCASKYNGRVSSLSDVFRVLTRLREEGIVTDYAVGGAMAVLFYAEPTRTYDVDVFALLPADTMESLAPLADIYRWAQREGFDLEGEHLMSAWCTSADPARQQCVGDRRRSYRTNA